MNIHIGNLSNDVSEEDLRQTFNTFGQVNSARIVKYKYSDELRGFGFIEMPDRAEAQTAIENLNGKDLLGQRMSVNEARAPADQGRTGGQGGRGRTDYSGRRNRY